MRARMSGLLILGVFSALLLSRTLFPSQKGEGKRGGSGPVALSSIIYHERDHDSMTVAAFSIVPDANGLAMTVHSCKGPDSTEEELRCDAAFNVREWHYRSNRNSDLLMRRTGNLIEVSGVFDGKKTAKILTIDARPWCQIIPMALSACPPDSLNHRSFWAVSLRGMAPLRAVAFRVADAIDTAQPGYPGSVCRRIHLKLDGMLARFWDGYYYLRKPDNVFVYNIGYTFGTRKPTGSIEVEFRREE